jgi:hypothetical protein
MNQQLTEAVKNNLNWFLNSEIMRPNDGFWSVAERIAVDISDETMAEINTNFPCQTQLDERTIVLQQRRADCAVETAMMFDLADEYFKDDKYRKIAQNIVDFLVNRSAMYIFDKKAKSASLWEWAMPKTANCWTDDNSWVVIGLLFLSSRGYGDNLKEMAVSTADAMHKHAIDYFDFIEKNGLVEYPEGSDTMHGLRLNPHWLGLLTMALSLADEAQGTNKYHEVIRKYYEKVLDGPPEYDERSCCQTESGVDWSISEYAYLALVGTITAKVYSDEYIAGVANHAGNILLAKQKADGHFASNHFETPEGEQYADLVYTQNWATLALQHLALYFPDNKDYRNSFEKSAKFLLRIQDNSDSLFFKGCWRGMYDCDAGKWGGGNKYEGGEGSIYSGWTNAPISISFLFELSSKSFLEI